MRLNYCLEVIRCNKNPTTYQLMNRKITGSEITYSGSVNHKCKIPFNKILSGR